MLQPRFDDARRERVVFDDHSARRGCRQQERLLRLLGGRLGDAARERHCELGPVEASGSERALATWMWLQMWLQMWLRIGASTCHRGGHRLS